MHVVHFVVFVVKDMNRALLSIFWNLFLIFIMCGCTQDKIEKGTEIIVNPNYSQTISWSDCNKFKLQQDSLMIGKISKSIYYDDKFLISTQGKLLLYSRDGNFIGQIGQRGRAANEYIGYTDCWIQDNHVYLYDMNGKKVLKYTLDNQLDKIYPLKSEVSPNTYPFAFIIPFGDGDIGQCVWNGSMKESPALAFYDKNFAFHSVIGHLTIRSGLRIGYPLIQSVNNTALYWNPLDRRIFRIAPDQNIKLAYTLSFGNKNYPELTTVKDDYEILGLYQDKTWRKNHAGIITYVWENAENLLFLYSYADNLHIGIYTQNTVSNYRLIDSKQSNILSSAFDGTSLYFFVEIPDGVEVYSIDLKNL